MPNSQRRPWVALDQWKADARAEKASADVALRKGFAGVFKAEGDAPNAPIRIRITTGTRDRSKDTVNPSGWRLDAYLANPVVLWAHDYHSFPIAKDTGLTLDANGLVGSPQFATADENPWAPYCEKLIRGGFLNAASVGFAPIKWLWNEEERGVDFQEQELLEYSIVPVPDNPGALVEAKAAGIEIGWIAEWAEKALDEWHGAPGLWVPRESIESARKIAKGSGLVMLVPGGESKRWDVVSLKSEDGGDDGTQGVDDEIEPKVGDRVRVRDGMAHDEMTKGVDGTVREVATPAIGIEFDGMDGVHKWYVAAELQAATEEEEGKSSDDDGMEMDDDEGMKAAKDDDTLEVDEDEDEEVLEVDEEEDEAKAIDLDAAELRAVVQEVLNESLGPALTALTGRID